MAAEILKDAGFAAECQAQASEVEEALTKYRRIKTSDGEIWAFEVDGYGNQLFMDDANIPGLLSLPYLGCCTATDTVCQRTRQRVLSDDNPYFFKGSAANGIGGAARRTEHDLADGADCSGNDEQRRSRNSAVPGMA
jgi:meiotically up-regulated gene 157 (Mug157) protein